MKRVRLTRSLGRRDYADLTIDNIAFTISRADLIQLGEDLVRLLVQFNKEQLAREDAK